MPKRQLSCVASEPGGGHMSPLKVARLPSGGQSLVARLPSGGQSPLKVARLVVGEAGLAREGGGYGRYIEAGCKKEVVEIYKEEVGGHKVFRCPFCDVKPLGSDIRFRKHLKTHHPTQKTLLRDSPRAALATTATQPGLQMFFPKPGLGGLEGEQPGDKQHLADLEEEDDEEFYLSPEGRLGEMPASLDSLEAGEIVYTDRKGEVAEEVVEEQVCGVCGCEAESGGGEGEAAALVLDSVLGRPASPHLCSRCSAVATEISRTKQSIRKLQRRLGLAVSRLVDLASLGRRRQEEDLGQGGLCCSQGGSPMCVRVVEEGRLSASCPHLGLPLVSQYRGRILGPGEVRGDDGSSPQAWQEDGRGEGQLYLTQEEWARAGLGMQGGEVQVPSSLVTGLGAGRGATRLLLSRALAQELPRPYFCLECDATFSVLGGLADHVQAHTDSQHGQLREAAGADGFDLDGFEDSLKIEVDNFSQQARIKDLTQTDKYRIELRSYMHKEQFKDCQDEVPSLEKPFQCKECGKTFSRAHDLWGHHASYRGPAFKCNFQSCEEVFLRLPDFAVHYSAHGGQLLVIPDNAPEKKSLHITCPVCQTVVPGLYKLQRHKMKHDPELKYKCPACPKQFVKANTLRAHITNVHKSGSKPQKKCKKCDTVVFSENGLYAHMKNAHGEDNSHPCPVCGELFLHESQLKEHGLSHMDTAQQPKVKKEVEKVAAGKVMEKVNQCPECECDLLDGDTLVSHFAAEHSGSEPRYQCSECSGGGGTERFLSLEGARRHYRQTHRGRPHTCWVCKESFGQESALHLHLAAAHSEVVGSGGEEGPVQCRYCDTVFPDHMERVAHTRFSHMVETIDITSTELEEVTMVGGHVIEFGLASDQIVALHTIP